MDLFKLAPSQSFYSLAYSRDQATYSALYRLWAATRAEDPEAQVDAASRLFEALCLVGGVYE